MRRKMILPTMEEKKRQMPESWTVITALDFVLEEAENSELSDDFWTFCTPPLDFLERELGLTKVQIVFLAFMIEKGTTVAWKDFAEFFACSRLMVMTYSEEFEELLVKGWIYRTIHRDFDANWLGFHLEFGVVDALRHNKAFVPKKMSELTIQEFIDRLEEHLDRFEECNSYLEAEEEWMMQMCKLNPQLELCGKVQQFKNKHTKSLLLLTVYDYAQWADSVDEGVTNQTVSRFYSRSTANDINKKLSNGSHPLIMAGVIEHKCDEGMADANRFVLTKKSKEELLAGYVPSRRQCLSDATNQRFLKLHTSIHDKQMFYNPTEQEQIAKLTHLLSQSNFSSVQERLMQKGLRKGFACLFYGGPGTGKTESVLQIAKQTGRDIMQIDIAGMRDKFIGESEKNIKAVFSNYREICKQSEVIPILFFNEADGIFSKRTSLKDGGNPAVEKMENAIQNIILQELEDLEGILIATTNLTNNLDSAFERRFLFKIEFHNPDNAIQAKLWNSMIQELTEEQAQRLACHYSLSGGQIENIARKHAIDYILSGSSPSIETLEGYCKAELLNKQSRQRIGF